MKVETDWVNPEQAQAEFSAKLAAAQTSGRTALTTGEMRPFSGIEPVQHAGILSVIMLLDEASQNQIVERVVQPFSTFAEDNGRKVTAARISDLFPHVTLDAFKMPEDPDQRAELLAEIQQNGSIQTLLRSFNRRGQQYNLDQLVVAPNSYICAGDFDGFQTLAYDGRMAARAIASQYGDQLKPYYPKYTDIFHSTIGRFLDVGSIPVEAYDAFCTQMGDSLKNNPIQVTPAGIYLGTSLDFYQQGAPHLVQS